jgi:hypothetical protein
MQMLEIKNRVIHLPSVILAIVCSLLVFVVICFSNAQPAFICSTGRGGVKYIKCTFGQDRPAYVQYCDTGQVDSQGVIGFRPCHSDSSLRMVTYGFSFAPIRVTCPSVSPTHKPVQAPALFNIGGGDAGKYAYFCETSHYKSDGSDSVSKLQYVNAFVLFCLSAMVFYIMFYLGFRLIDIRKGSK